MPSELDLTALQLSHGLALTPSHLERIARATSPEAARWAFDQWALRKRALGKFELADEMLFVREALEQATHERVAAYHASLFPPGVEVADLTTGIGADLIALARRGPAVGFELDVERAEFARHNLAAHGLTGVVRCGDGLVGGRDSRFVYADPARRVEGRRTLDVSEFAPHPQAVAELPNVHLGVMKLSPMLRDEALEALAPSLEFVSFQGECREALLQFGSLAQSGRWAVLVETDERVPAGDPAVEVEAPSDYLFDADPALVRAHAVGTIARRYELRLLGSSLGYLTGSEPLDSPWLRPYRVLHHGKADPKATKAALRRLDAATPELKQRCAGLELVSERKKYASEGKRKVSLVIWPVGRSLRHTIVEAA